MGDSPAPNARESTAAMLSAYRDYLPSLVHANSLAQPELDATRLNSINTVSPAEAAIQDYLFKTYGPSLAKTQSDINEQNSMASAKTDANVINGPGTDLVKSGLNLSKIADPEFYKLRDQEATATSNLLSGMNPNELTGSESAAMERGVNRINSGNGTGVTPTATSTAGNALLFGKGLQEKQNNFSQALAAATGALPNFRSGVDVFKEATGKSGLVSNNAANSQFTGVKDNTDANNNFGQSFMNTIGGFQSQAADINSNRRDVADRINGAISSING